MEYPKKTADGPNHIHFCIFKLCIIHGTIIFDNATINSFI